MIKCEVIYVFKMKPFKEDVMKRVAAVAFSLLSISMSSALHAEQEKSSVLDTLPTPYESVFSTAMNDPNVMIYFGDKFYREGDYAKSLKWLLEAAQYNHPAAVKNAKYLIHNGQGTKENRESVVAFLEYYAQPRGDDAADPFAQIYLADYYRGDKCVWLGNDRRPDCVESIQAGEPLAAKDLKQSYFYFESAAESGDARARYVTGMMNILGLGAPRNVPLGLDYLRPLAEKGNTAAAYIVGAIYQDGYWMPQDREEASKWFALSANTKHPASLLYLAKNAESGIMDASLDERLSFAEDAYMDVMEGVLASDEERSEAAYRLGLLYASNSHMENNSDAARMMRRAVSYAQSESNEHAVRALVWFGERSESSDLSQSVMYYEQAISKVKELPLDVQQRNGSIYEKIAYAYGRGQEGILQRDERMFSKYMKERHVLSAKTYISPPEGDFFHGYSAFNYSG
jgi:TPR repeat protein